MKVEKYKKIYIKVMLMIIGMLYILFLGVDFFNMKTFISIDIIKYISIVFCFIITLIIGKDAINVRDRYLLQLGFFFTVIADLCLLILGYFKMGVAFFCIVQTIYFIRYKTKKKYLTTKYITILIIVLTTCFIINYLWLKADILLPIAVFYSICLINSVIGSIKLFKNKKYPLINRYMIVIGMILFLLCDINVGLYNMSLVVNLKPSFIKLLRDISYPLIWGFYLPSQVLLSISGYKTYTDKF